VFDELVTITGDQTAILDLAEPALPTVDPLLLSITQTLEAVTLTPGGILTVTANARVIPAPEGAENAIAVESTEIVNGSIAVPPTFTYPPDVSRVESDSNVEAQPTISPPTQASETTNEMPPIVPILALGGIGVIGLLLSAIRR
jgi:hypothetical protein